MTPEDVAAIRADVHPFARSETTILALCDALEAAWAERDASDEGAEQAQSERDEAKNELTVLYGELSALITRAELAEAEVARLNVVIFDNNHVWARDITARNDAQCALARVQALCDDDVDSDIGPAVPTKEIRAAIEGEK